MSSSHTHTSTTGPWWWQGHNRHYVLVWFGLLGALLVSLAAGMLETSTTGIAGAILVIAFVKAFMVVSHFMHLKAEPRLVQSLIAFAMFVLLALYVGLYPDVVERAGTLESRLTAAAIHGDSDDTAPPPLTGKQLFQRNCSACHGLDARGVPSLGKDLVTSEFCRSRTEAELVAFIATGRAADDPANTTRIAMPPKGGNVALSETDLASIVQHVRTLQAAVK